MSTEDRFLRLENALATLAELSANHEQRIARLEESFVRLEESSVRLEEAFGRLEEAFGRHEEGFVRLGEAFVRLEEAFVTRVPRLEESFVMLVALARSHEERIDRANEGIDQLRVAQASSEQKIAALADAQIRGEDAMKELRNALADAHTRTEAALATLTEKVNLILDERQGGSQPAN